MYDGIFYPTTKEGEVPQFVLKEYFDTAFGDCLLSRKTTGGYLFCLNGALIAWQSKRQSIVTTSTTKAEYVAVCEATKKAIWLKRLLEDMDCEQKSATVLFEDNNSARAQTENPLHYKRTKHVDIAYHFTRQMVSEEVVKLVRINSEDQVADLLTKPLVKATFARHHNELKMKKTELVNPTNV